MIKTKEMKPYERFEMRLYRFVIAVQDGIPGGYAEALKELKETTMREFDNSELAEENEELKEKLEQVQTDLDLVKCAIDDLEGHL